VLLETAIAIPVLAVIAAALAWALSLAVSSLALQEAARQVARDVARGVEATAAVTFAQEALPGAAISVREAGDRILVEASRMVPAPVPLLAGVTVPLTQQVSIPREWVR
jgi:short subunit fatty acids transporter